MNGAGNTAGSICFVPHYEFPFRTREFVSIHNLLYFPFTKLLMLFFTLKRGILLCQNPGIQSY